tara:strand:- start:338 stop:469 length:132 start_codon:yes stop_codon:yes gene_type:complete
MIDPEDPETEFQMLVITVCVLSLSVVISVAGVVKLIEIIADRL